MIIVECINPFTNFPPKIQEAIEKGAKPPKIGGLYEVAEHINYQNIEDYPHLIEAGFEKYEGYVLKEIDFTEYGIKAGWRKGNFRVHKEEFTPNESGWEEVKMNFNFSFDTSDNE